MEKYFGKLIEDYEQILDNEFVDLKKRLLGKLEGILNGENSQEDLFNKPFDYNALPKCKTRITDVLKPVIETYGELQEKCYKNFTDKNGGNRSWHGEKEYSLFLGKYRYLGKKSVDSVISHLNQINFDFSEESAKKTFEKNKAQ